LALSVTGDAGATATVSVAACICRDMRRQNAIESLPPRGQPGPLQECLKNI
jgi:hypothetical protein